MHDCENKSLIIQELLNLRITLQSTQDNNLEYFVRKNQIVDVMLDRSGVD